MLVKYTYFTDLLVVGALLLHVVVRGHRTVGVLGGRVLGRGARGRGTWEIIFIFVNGIQTESTDHSRIWFGWGNHGGKEIICNIFKKNVFKLQSLFLFSVDSRYSEGFQNQSLQK